MRTKQNKTKGKGNASKLPDFTEQNRQVQETVSDFKARLKAMHGFTIAERKTAVHRSEGDKGYGYPAGANPDPTKPL